MHFRRNPTHTPRCQVRTVPALGEPGRNHCRNHLRFLLSSCLGLARLALPSALRRLKRTTPPDRIRTLPRTCSPKDSAAERLVHRLPKRAVPGLVVGPKRTDPFGRGCIPTRTRPLQQLSAAQRPSGTPEPNRPHQRTNAFRFAWASFLPSGGDDTAGRASDGRDAPSLRARLARQKDRVATQSGSSPLRLVRRFWALNRHRREDSQQGRSRKGIDELVTRANMGSDREHEVQRQHRRGQPRKPGEPPHR